MRVIIILVLVVVVVVVVDGASTTSCGNRFMQFTTLWLKKHILHCFSDLISYSFSYVL